MTAVVRRPGPTAEAADRERADATTVGVVEAAGDKRAVLDAVAKALSFPSHFGHNLDALEDCVHDLAWLPEGPVTLVWDDTDLRRDAPALHATVLDILTGAADDSVDGPRPLSVVLVGAPPE